ncbi:MAG: hypothetical protein AAB629_01410 [Patescibacteria group bacterium]
MLTPYSQSRFVQKILTSASGKRFRVLFLVTLVNGEVKAQIVSAQSIMSALSFPRTRESSVLPKNKILCLPFYSAKAKHNTEYIPSNAPEVSPYAELYFFTSQPTRAPSCR